MRSMKTLELNRIALWRPKLLDEFTVRESGAGRPFVQDKIISKTTKKTFRYAKNYKTGDVKFCLFVITYLDDAKVAEKRLDEVAEKIEPAVAQKVVIDSSNSNFEYTDFYMEEK